MKASKASPETLQREWSAQLADGLAQMQLALSAAQQQQLVDYLQLLNKWNSVYNLTAVRDPAEMVSRQLLDSLSILPWMRGPRILDVGCGGGLPGIPLAIAMPQAAFMLIDSNGKKTRFVQQAAIQLKLENLQVTQARVEQFKDANGFDTITSRAFADLHLMIELTSHLRAPGGQWAAMKSGLDELAPGELPAGCAHQVVDLTVPGEQAARRLVIVR